jgi:hypothetical protein
MTMAYRERREKIDAVRRAKAEAIQQALTSEMETKPVTAPAPPKKDPFEGISLGELKKFHKVISDHFTMRFAEVRSGFRMLDQDQSGTLSKKEMRALVHLFNIAVPDRIIDAFLRLADYNDVRPCPSPCGNSVLFGASNINLRALSAPVPLTMR